jgi:uroporphyrinogen decarboxylase
MHVHTPVWDAQSVDDLKKHTWPNNDIFDYSVMREQCDRYRDYAVLYEGADLFTRPCILRNMENVMLDMIERPEMAHYLIGKFTDFYCADITRALEATRGGFDFYCEWSDFGTQRGLLMSISMFREFMAPPLKRMIDLCHSAGLKFMLHSCGAIRALIPDFIALGVDILDPIQVAAQGMDPAALKREFGDKLAFHGGICTQQTLPFGTPDDVRRSVLDRVATLGAGGGYILASSHDISADTPPENVTAMYDPALRTLG